MHFLAIYLNMVAPALSISMSNAPQPDASALLGTALKPVVMNVISVLRALMPAIIVFRVGYQFAQHKGEGSIWGPLIEAGFLIVVAEGILMVVGIFVQSNFNFTTPTPTGTG
jgi:hypothetical protein